jgi:hypothetical protein
MVEMSLSHENDRQVSESKGVDAFLKAAARGAVHTANEEAPRAVHGFLRGFFNFGEGVIRIGHTASF